MEANKAFLGRIPGEPGWREIELKSEHDMKQFVGKNLDRIELVHGIDLWVDDTSFQSLEEITDLLSIVVKKEGGFSMYHGNAFLATTDDNGHIVPLSKEQVKKLQFRSRLQNFPFSNSYMLIANFESIRKVGDMLWP